MKKVRLFFLAKTWCFFASWFKAKSLEDASDDAREALKLSETQGLSRITSSAPPKKRRGTFCDHKSSGESLGLMEFGRWFETNVVGSCFFFLYNWRIFDILVCLRSQRIFHLMVSFYWISGMRYPDPKEKACCHSETNFWDFHHFFLEILGYTPWNCHIP